MKIKRWVAALLCVLLIGGLFPTRAFAADIPWYLDAEGVLHITGHIDESGFNLTDEQKQQVKSAVAASGASISSGELLFSGFKNMTSADLSLLNTTDVTNMSFMFMSCSSLTSLDVSGFDISSVTDMSYMFYGCSSLTSLNLSNFNTSSVTTMAGMFSGCSSLTSLDVSGFRTNSVTNMIGMFTNCSSLTSLDLSKFETGNVTQMSFMFNGCSSLTSLDLNKFITGNVTSMAAMFINCSGLTSLDLSSFDTSSVNNMGGMFEGCSSLTSLEVSGFKTDSLESAEEMFCGCSSLASLGIRPDILYKNAEGIIAIHSSWQKQGSTDTYSTADELKAVTDTVTLLAMYTVNVQNDGNGTASANTTAAVKGETVTLTATPDTGYHFKEWQSSDVTVSNNTFTMPEQNVTVKAAFDAHSFTNYVSDGNATCTEDGTKTAKCDYCDATDTIADTGSFSGHGETEIRDAKAATCTEDGYTGDTYCMDCGVRLASGETIPAKGHGETEIRDAKEATCTEAGFTGDTYCKICGDKIADGTAIDVKAHTYGEWATTKEPTLTEKGLKERSCTACGDKQTEELPVLTPVTYSIISGANGEWTKDSSDGLAFTSDADFAKFVCVKVDGAEIAETNYAAVSGSTKVTLNAAYLETLSVGSHSIDVVSNDGTASTSFTVKAETHADPTNPTGPQTGDNSHMFLWIALLLVSGGALVGTTVYSRKKKYNAK